MGGGGSLSKSRQRQNNQSNFGQNVWDAQSPALSNLYGNARSLYGDTNAGMQSRIPFASDFQQGVASGSVPAWLQQMRGGAYANMDIARNLSDSLQQSENRPSSEQEINAMIMGGEGNNYADAMRGQYIADANRATDNMLRNLDARAAASGMSGGSRHGTATAAGMRDINQNLQANMARTGYETFDRDLDRKLDIARRADESTLRRQSLMSDMLSNQQSAMQGGLNFGSNLQNLGMGQFNPYMAPWQAATNYAQVVGGPTVLSSGDSSGMARGKGFGTSGYGGMGGGGKGGGGGG